MKDLQREILNQVAAGTITAAEGAARLQALETPVELPRPAAPATATATATARRVKVVSRFANAEIVGDPSVDFAVAEGPHRARQDGDTLVIEQSFMDDEGTFSFGGVRRAFNGPDLLHRNLIVRMNPDLALHTTVQAGNVRIDGVHGPITAEVQAGNCEVDDFRSPFNLVSKAGNVTAKGRLDSGASKIRCAMGSVKVNLEKGSSVRITAHTTMGDVAIEGSGASEASGGVGKVVMVGSGSGTLECDCTMGEVRVFAD
jgi:hypothetical protein